MSTPNAEKDVEIVGHSDIAEENIEWYSLSAKQFNNFFKNKQENRQKLNVQLPYGVGSHWTVRCSSQRKEDLGSHKNLDTNVYTSIICNNPKLEIAHMCFRGWMANQTVVHLYFEILT